MKRDDKNKNKYSFQDLSKLQCLKSSLTGKRLTLTQIFTDPSFSGPPCVNPGFIWGFLGRITFDRQNQSNIALDSAKTACVNTQLNKSCFYF